MTDLRVVGIDPGPVPGIVLLDYFESGALARVEALQCTHGVAAELVDLLLLDWQTPALVQVERYVVGRRSSRSSTAGAGQVTRDLVGALVRIVDANHDARLLQRNAGQVKPWATDERLDAAGLTEITKGMRHARDAARHALFAAVHDGGIPDPLSRGARP